jgi:transcriptional regulator with AAA-type ATPase domain
MINIYQLDREQFPVLYNQDALNSVAQILEKRVNRDKIFASNHELLELVKASGGHIRQLMQLMQRACLTASGRGHSKIEADDVDYAIKQLQFSFERSLTKKYFTELAYISQNKEFSDEDDNLKVEMLYSTAVLEYNGTDRWNYPNPLLMKSHAFQKAMKSLLAST